ncbi:MAG: hypothetical protein AAFY60_22575, partial [Myxococcota bacterium]
MTDLLRSNDEIDPLVEKIRDVAPPQVVRCESVHLRMLMALQDDLIDKLGGDPPGSHAPRTADMPKQRPGFLATPVTEPDVNELNDPGGNKYDTLFIALPHHSDGFPLEIDIIDIQRHDFGSTKTTTIQKREDRTVTRTSGDVLVRLAGLENRRKFGFGQATTG